jgi:hypothetical protein
MIGLHFGIPLDQVEQRSIVEYRLMLFTLFNSLGYQLGAEFKHQLPDEEVAEVDRLAEYYKSKGYFK